MFFGTLYLDINCSIDKIKKKTFCDNNKNVSHMKLRNLDDLEERLYSFEWFLCYLFFLICSAATAAYIGWRFDKNILPTAFSVYFILHAIMKAIEYFYVKRRVCLLKEGYI